MIRERVDVSPVRQFLMGLVGLVLTLGAVDILWGHWLSTPPHTANEVVTTKGRSQQRADIVWGSAFLIGGAALFGVAVVSLMRRRPVLLIRDDGLEVFVSGPAASDFISWDAVRSVRSSVERDEDASRPRDVLVVEVVDPAALPADPWGAEWQGSELRIDAGSWQPDVVEVVVHAQLAIDEYRRDRAT